MKVYWFHDCNGEQKLIISQTLEILCKKKKNKRKKKERKHVRLFFLTFFQTWYFWVISNAFLRRVRNCSVSCLVLVWCLDVNDRCMNWNRLPREVMESPFLKKLKTWLDSIYLILIQWVWIKNVQLQRPTIIYP